MVKKNTNSYLGLVFILGSLAAVGPFSIDMYLPAFEQIAGDFGTDKSNIGYTLTSYFIGISVGQLTFGPLSDRFGRKLPTQIGLITFILSAFLIFLAQSLEMMIWLRVFMALGGGMGMVTSKAIVRDSFEPQKMAKFFSTLMLVMGVAPIIAPLLGGFLSEHFGWRMIFIFLAVYPTIILIAVTLFLKETKKSDASISLRPKSVFRDYITVLTQRQFMSYAFAGALSYAGLFAYISGGPTIYMSYFGFSEQTFGVVFGVNAAGYIGGAQINSFLLNKSNSQTVSKYVILIQIFFIGIGLISWHSDMHFDYFGVIGIWAFLFCLGFITPNTTSLAMAPFKKFAGSASALIGSIGMLVGSIITAIVSVMDNGTPSIPITVMFLCSVIAAIIMWRYNYLRPPMESYYQMDDRL